MQTVCRDCFHEYEQEHDGPCPRCDSPRQVMHEELFDLTMAHIDCDAFYASIEKRDNPALLSKPLIIGGGHRGVVSTACYLARGYGVHSAMPMFKANKLCPDAVVMPPNMKKYAAASKEIREIFDHLTPLVEPLSIDEAFLDLSGTEKLHHARAAASLARAAKEIEQNIGITVSIGLSYNKFLAKMASDMNKPRGFSVVGRAEAPGFLARQPISNMWGVGKVTQAKMKRNGITTIGQLQHMDKHDLMKSYGILGERLYHFSRGEDVRTVSPDSKVKSISNEITLDTDIADFDRLRKLLWPLCEKVSSRLKAKHLAGWTITLKLKTANFRQVSRSLSLDSPTRMAEVIFETGMHLLKPECQGLEYRLIGIGVGNLASEDGADQPDLVDTGKTKKLEAEKAMDKIRGRFGTDKIKKGRNF
ncbi:DNA polymerase IV [Emcibacter sp.]|uniref:DNA polymerase IV n=1 Tax=Emcibacter sp. TaxID=1979954 RepID=UPI003A8E55AA